MINLGKAKKLRQGVRADRDPAAQRCQAQRIQRLRSTASQSSGRGSLEAPKFPVPHAALNLQGLFKGYRAVTAAVPPAGDSRLQPSAFLPRLSAFEDIRNDAATQGAFRLCASHIQDAARFSVNQRAEQLFRHQVQDCALGQLPEQTECPALLSWKRP